MVDEVGNQTGDQPELEIVSKNGKSFRESSLPGALAISLAVVAHASRVHATSPDLIAKTLGAGLELVRVVSTTLFHVVFVVGNASLLFMAGPMHHVTTVTGTGMTSSHIVLFTHGINSPVQTNGAILFFLSAVTRSTRHLEEIC
jgi:hypothetical protein